MINWLLNSNFHAMLPSRCTLGESFCQVIKDAECNQLRKRELDWLWMFQKQTHIRGLLTHLVLRWAHCRAPATHLDEQLAPAAPMAAPAQIGVFCCCILYSFCWLLLLRSVPRIFPPCQLFLYLILCIEFIKGIVHNFFVYCSNLIFWIVMGCGIADFGRRGL